MGARNRERDSAVAASWQQHHCSLSAPGRSAGTAAAARSCGVAAAIATILRCRCDDALGLPWCRSTRLCVEPTKSRWDVCCQTLLPSRRCAAAVATMRSVFPGAAALAHVWNLRNAETRAVRPTENPLTSLSSQRLARRGAHASPFSNPAGYKFCYTAWVVRSADRQGTAQRLAWPPNLRPLVSFRDSPRQTRNLFF